MFARITKFRFTTILIISLVGIFVLLFQTFDYYFLMCDYCKSLRQVFGIPISLIGLVFITSTLIEIFLIGALSAPFVITRNFVITLNNLRHLYWILTTQSILAIFGILGLLYVELTVTGPCTLCTITQGAILVNNILIFSWRPFKSIEPREN